MVSSVEATYQPLEIEAENFDEEEEGPEAWRQHQRHPEYPRLTSVDAVLRVPLDRGILSQLSVIFHLIEYLSPTLLHQLRTHINSNETN